MVTQIAIIFDMDGVLLENNVFHHRAWKIFLQRHGIQLTSSQMEKRVYGKRNDSILTDIFGKKLAAASIQRYGLEKEQIYRSIFPSTISPTKGVRTFLLKLKKAGIPFVLATSAPTKNVRFNLSKIKMTKLFKYIIDAHDVKKGKPSPEIFLKAAKKIRISPKNCIVFEDALAGIKAAKRAKMKIVGLTTTHTRKELKECDLVIKDFTSLKIENLQRMVDQL